MKSFANNWKGSISLVSINNGPAASNAMSRSTPAQLAETPSYLDANPGVSAIIPTGTGERAFGAGLDLRELGAHEQALIEVATDDPRLNPAAAIDLCATPVIGAINGVCVPGTLEVVLACEILIAADSAQFADTHVKVGILQVWGLSQLPSRIIGPGRAREMSPTGRFIDAKATERWGLVNTVVRAAALIDTALDLAAALRRTITRRAVANKALMKQGFALDLGEAMIHERAIGRHLTPMSRLPLSRNGVRR